MHVASRNQFSALAIDDKHLSGHTFTSEARRNIDGTALTALCAIGTYFSPD